MSWSNPIKKIFTRLLVRFIDPMLLMKEYEDRRIEGLKSMVRMGLHSKFYPTSQIHNLQGRPDSISIGDNTHLRGELLVFQFDGHIEIGNFTFVGEGSRIWSAKKVTIGSHVLISHNVNISDTDVHEMNAEERGHGFMQIVLKGHSDHIGHVAHAPIVIGDNAWINVNVIILKGVVIGKGAIVASGSVVTHDVEPYTLVAGNPARKIKDLNHGPAA